jgi:hypothetical protein
LPAWLSGELVCPTFNRAQDPTGANSAPRLLLHFLVRKLIVNADDFGLTAGVNRAIVETHRDGVVSSTT